MPRVWSEYHSLNDSGLDINKKFWTEAGKNNANGKQITEAEDPFQSNKDNNGVTLFSVTLAKTTFFGYFLCMLVQMTKTYLK